MMCGVARPSHPILYNLGVTIRLLRQQRGLSQEALASLAAIDRSYMSGIERGRRNLSVLNMARIAAALRVPLGDLVQPTLGGQVAMHQLVGDEPVQRTTDAVDELAETLPQGTSFQEAAAPWEVLAHARESRLVVIAGGFDELQREALLHTVANRHPGLPVVSLEPADTPAG